jgi:hypothetical protein
MSELKTCRECRETHTCDWCGLTRKLVPIDNCAAPELPEGFSIKAEGSLWDDFGHLIADQHENKIRFKEPYLMDEERDAVLAWMWMLAKGGRDE